MKKFFKKTEGFTLVELIVVIAILGVLAGVGTVGYSGYIKKANQAADRQLINTINSAYAVACLQEGVDASSTTASAAISGKKLDGGSITVTAPAAKADDIEANFVQYFAENADAEFKVTEALYFANGAFVADFDRSAGVDYTGLVNSLKEKFADDITNKILPTNLGAIGTETLFGQMNNAMDMAGELNLVDMTGGPFMEAFSKYMGINLADYESDEEINAAMQTKLDELGVEGATAMTHAIALYAAQNSAGLTIDGLGNWLGGGKDTDDLAANPNANTLAEAAAIYGMYLSYQKETTGTVPTDSTLDIMTDALTDSAFATWVSTNDKAQAELDAYKTYMSIVNEAAKDDSARGEILTNGFKNPELESLMKDLIGS